jgi:hypothetical protein
MEGVVEQVNARSARELREARGKVEAYLRAWRLPEGEIDELATLVMTCVERRWRDEDVELERAAIEEAERMLRGRFDEMLSSMLPTTSSLTTQRPPETRPMTMETSLSRLPSFRMIAGWFVIIALIVLAFIFTR